MKKLSNLFYMSAMAAVVFLSGCSKSTTDPKPAPTVSITGATGSTSNTSGYYSTGDKVTITFSATTGENIDQIVVSEVTYGSSTVTTPLKTIKSGFTSKTTDSESYEYTILSSSGPIDLKVEVKDDKGATASTIFTIKLLSTYTAKLLGAQHNAAGAYFSSKTGLVYTGGDFAANVNNIDITFAEIGSPLTVPTILSSDQRGTEGLTTGTGGLKTYFKSSSLDFSSAKASDLAGITASTSQKTSVSQNGVYEFVNPTLGTKGLIKVTNLVAGSDLTKTDGSVTIDVKVIK